MKKKQNARGNRGLWEMDKVKKAALRYAFPKTAPVMVGYLFLGAAYGILMKVNGFGFGWALAMVF